MTKPILTTDKKQVFEGEVVKLRCELPEEEPPLYFFFRKIKMNSTPQVTRVNERHRNFSVVEISVEEGDNILQFDCYGGRYVSSEFETSEHSNTTLVTVKGKFHSFSLYISLLAIIKKMGHEFMCVLLQNPLQSPL